MGLLLERGQRRAQRPEGRPRRRMRNDRPMRVVIAAGGTAGHVVPALAVAGALRADGHDVVFVGASGPRPSSSPPPGSSCGRSRCAGLSRSNPVAAGRAVLLAGRATGAASKILRAERADVVLGGGGYVAGRWGWRRCETVFPLVLTEADSHLGVTNRLLARFAARVCLAFPIEGREPPRFIVTGRPVPPPATRRRRGPRAVRAGGRRAMVLVFGGSLGARSINRGRDRGVRRRALPRAPRRGLARLRLALGAAGRLRPARVHLRVRRGAARGVADRRAGGRVGVRDRRARHARDPRPVSARHRRPPDRQRALDGAGGRRGRPARRGDHARAAARPRSTRCSATRTRLAAMAAASRSLARPDAAAVIAREVVAAAKGSAP